jgi:rhodanese-related sulfurtransferase
MKTKLISKKRCGLLSPIVALGICSIAPLPHVCAGSTVYDTTLGETKPVTPEISTAQLKQILADRSGPVLDVRFAQEHAIAHIPGSINIYEKEIETITQRLPDKATSMVLYCNGPFCGKSKRVSAELVKKLGYTNVKRYQLGLPIWRALGNTVQTDLAGLQYVVGVDKTAVLVDARSRGEFEEASLPGAVNILAGEAEQANEPTDGRLPHKDKGTRVIVFASDPKDARKVAEEIAKKAYWNSSYFGGTTDELKAKGLWQQKKPK